MGIISTSYELGNVGSLLLCGALVEAGFGWRALFVINPLMFGAVGLAVYVALGRSMSSDAVTADVVDAARTESVGRRLAWLASVPSFWMAMLLSFLLSSCVPAL